MKVKALVFRFRVWIILALYVLGFMAPWQRLFPSGPAVTLWLAASTWVARAGKVDIEVSTLAVTITALCCFCLGAALRLWGTAYLSSSVVQDSAMHGDRLVAAGPYRHLRNPLYAGSFLLAVGTSILMPASGALFFLAGLSMVYLTLISGEEDFLTGRLGDEYQEYRRRVPRLLPRLSAGVPAAEARPRWVEAALAEIWPVAFTLCFAVLAWRYNSLLLIKCLIVCYGLSLVARAMLPRSSRAA